MENIKNNNRECYNATMPTIGIGAGKYCDGQVLIIYDLLGINERKFKHSPEYINIRELMIKTIHQYKYEIDDGIFPNESQTNIIDDLEYNKINDWCLEHNIIV